MWSFFFIKLYNDIGKAINDDNTTENIDSSHPITKPITSINLISPPPNDSFLNNISPNNFNKYINTNGINISNNIRGILLPVVIFNISINIPNTISIESGIIIYKISDIISIIDMDTNNNTIIVFIDKPNTK